MPSFSLTTAATLADALGALWCAQHKVKHTASHVPHPHLPHSGREGERSLDRASDKGESLVRSTYDKAADTAGAVKDKARPPHALHEAHFASKRRVPCSLGGARTLACPVLPRTPCSCSCGSMTLWGSYTASWVVLVHWARRLLVLLMMHQPHLQKPWLLLRCTAPCKQAAGAAGAIKGNVKGAAGAVEDKARALTHTSKDAGKDISKCARPCGAGLLPSVTWVVPHPKMCGQCWPGDPCKWQGRLSMQSSMHVSGDASLAHLTNAGQHDSASRVLAHALRREGGGAHRHAKHAKEEAADAVHEERHGFLGGFRGWLADRKVSSAAADRLWVGPHAVGRVRGGVAVVHAAC